MQAIIDELAKQAGESLAQVSSKETLASFWQEYLSKNGKIAALMKNLRTVAPEERPSMGKVINELSRRSRPTTTPQPTGSTRPSWPPGTPPRRWTSPCPPRSAPWARCTP